MAPQEEEDNPHENESFPFLRDQKAAVLKCFDTTNTPTELVLDDNLFDSIGLIVDANELKKKKVLSWNKLSHWSDIVFSASNVVLFLSPTLESTKKLINLILLQREKRSLSKICFYLYFLPTDNAACRQLLKDENVMEEILTIDSLPIYFYPHQSDLLSLALPSFYSDYYCRGIRDGMHYVAEAIMDLQKKVTGIIPNIISVGHMGQEAMNAFIDLKVQEARCTNSTNQRTNSINYNKMILIDREVDLITPFITAFTYESLLDELIGVQNGIVEMDVEIFPPDALQMLTSYVLEGEEETTGVSRVISNERYLSEKENKKKRVVLNLYEEDIIYPTIQSELIENLSLPLLSKARSIQAFQEQKENMSSMYMIHMYVSKMNRITREKTAITFHINVATHLSKLIDLNTSFHNYFKYEERISLGEMTIRGFETILLNATHIDDFYQAYRLLILYSQMGYLTHKGMMELRRLFIDFFGIESAILFTKLVQSHLLRINDTESTTSSSSLLLPTKTTKSASDTASKSNHSTPLPNISHSYNYQTIKDQFNLIDQSESSNKNGVEKVCAGFTPLSIRLIQLLSTNDVEEFQQQNQITPLPGINISQLFQGTTSKAQSATMKKEKLSSLLSLLNTPIYQVTQILPPCNPLSIRDEYSGVDNDPSDNIVLFFMGGVTPAELSAIRIMKQMSKRKINFLIVTTQIINHKRLIQSLSF